ncbi:unnamed protein product [Vicia faba]|uniref:Uncharacterized protein n=1 Tax=Vicia faba TaxID=3906 RepID=A0AAV1A266_VICFA|nr:unnamed protein product [Vicia faba]
MLLFIISVLLSYTLVNGAANSLSSQIRIPSSSRRLNGSIVIHLSPSPRLCMTVSAVGFSFAFDEGDGNRKSFESLMKLKEKDVAVVKMMTMQIREK